MKKILILIAVVAVGAFAWWTISPLFIDKVVEDTLDPEIAVLLQEQRVASTTTPPRKEDLIIVGLEDMGLNTSEPILDDKGDTEPAELVPTPTPPEPTTSVSEPFPLIDTPGHAATGDIRVIQTPDETIVRYENYDGTNGPDLKVYLTNDLDATDFVNLGTAKGNQGNINYTVPSDVDIDEYKYVMTWCEAFGVLFDYAEIN